MSRSSFLLALVALTAFSASTALAQPVLGQIDTFQASSTDLANWNGAPSLFNTTPGMGGASDRFMQITAIGGSSTGSRLIVYNTTQWVGNYTAAGITGVDMDFKVISGGPLSMRYVLRQGSGLGGGNVGYVSTTAAVIPNDGLWHHALFLLGAGHLTAVGSPPPLATMLTTQTEARILHSAAPNTVLSEPIVGVLGVDNIRAVPEPGSLALLTIAAAVATARRWRRRRAA